MTAIVKEVNEPGVVVLIAEPIQQLLPSIFHVRIPYLG